MFDQWDIVKFSQPENDKEAALRFIILQVRDDRLLVELVDSGMSIPPQFVYLASDMQSV